MSGPTNASTCPRCGQPAIVTKVREGSLSSGSKAVDLAVDHLESGSCPNYQDKLV